MDKRKPLTSKRPERRRDTAPVLVIPPRLVHSALGAVLIAAGTIKLYEFAFVSQDEGATTLLLAAFAEAELLGGIWLVAGFDAARTHWWALAAFSGLATAGLFQALAGKCSCGCFGSLTISPWLALVFDLAAVAALLAWRPPVDPKERSSVHSLHVIGMVFVAALIGVVGRRQADLVTVAGTATAGGRPLGEATLTLTGPSGRKVARTSQDGAFHLPFVRPGRYAVSLTGGDSISTVRSKEVGQSLRKKKKTTRRSRQQPPSPLLEIDGLVTWIHLGECSEYDKIIEFQ